MNNTITREYIKHRNKILQQFNNTFKFIKYYISLVAMTYEYIWLSCIYSHFKHFQNSFGSLQSLSNIFLSIWLIASQTSHYYTNPPIWYLACIIYRKIFGSHHEPRSSFDSKALTAYPKFSNSIHEYQMRDKNYTTCENSTIIIIWYLTHTIWQWHWFQY